MKKFWKRYGLAMTTVGAMLLLFLAVSLQVHARAGGGEGYQGPSGGGGGGGGGGGDALFFLIAWLFSSRTPFSVKIIALIIIVALLYFGRSRMKMVKSGLAGTRSTPLDSIATAFSGAGASVAATAGAAALNVSRQIAELKSRDPDFSEQQFEDLASTAFFKVQEAWSKRDLSIARAFMSPALFSRFQTQIDGLKAAGKVNKMDNLAVGSVQIVEAVHDGGFDYVTVQINASAADYMVDQKTGKLLSGSQQPQPFTEYWTFLRSDQVKTKAGGTALESKQCPNCGAPLQVNALGKCDYCGSEVTSGAFSWVLSEITQASVWRPRAASAPRPETVSPLAGGRYVLGLVQCPQCGANVQDIAGITNERCWRCGATVPTEK